MKYTIELDEKDIKKIIAKEFDVQENQVTVYTKSQTYGYGRQVYEKTVVYAKVEKLEE